MNKIKQLFSKNHGEFEFKKKFSFEERLNEIEGRDRLDFKLERNV